MPITVNGISIKADNTRNVQQQQQQSQHLNQISETPDLWELDMEPYFEQSSLTKDDNSWFSNDYKNSNSHFMPNPLNNASFATTNSNNSFDHHSSNDNTNPNSLDFQQLTFPINMNNNSMGMMNQATTSAMQSSSIPSSVIDKNLWNSILPSLLNNNNAGKINNINESISLLQKALAAANNNNNNNNNNDLDHNNSNNNTIGGSSSNASTSPFIGFNDINVVHSNNLQLLNQINELNNSLNAEASVLNVNKSSISGLANINKNNNLHPSSAAMMSNSISSKQSATLSKPINIRNPERRDFTGTSYNARLMPNNTPSSSFSSYFSTSPNSYFSIGGYSGTNLPAAPNNSFNFNANFPNNNLKINNSTNNNIESWVSNVNAKVMEPPLIEVPRSWYFSKDEVAKNSETIILPKRFFKNEIPECYDNRKSSVLFYIYNIYYILEKFF